MARKELPYPASPKSVPEDLTLPSPKFVRQATYLVILIVFVMLFYLALMSLCIYGFYWSITARAAPLGKLVVALGSGLLFFFLIKNFLTRSNEDPDRLFEVTDQDEPKLFEFIERICEEVNAPFPNRIYLAPFMDMHVQTKLSLLHLFKPGKKSMVIGLGMLNFFNLSEFKAVIAHELGHFAQKSFFVSYSVAARRIIASLFVGNDSIDRFLNKYRRLDHIGGYICQALWMVVWGIKHFLLLIFRMITAIDFKMAYEQEHICDLFGVKVAGSNAAVHALKRSSFAGECLTQALNDLEVAADHRIYSSDIYFHQTAAATLVKRRNKDPRYGDPPKLKTPMDGKKVQVFDPDKDSEVEPGDCHPSMYDREENCKKDFIPCPIDERSPWELFEDPDDLRERFSYKFYRIVHKVKKDVELNKPEEVQKFIDEEHAEMTYDPKYGGVYDGRFLDPGDLLELDEMIEKEPWEDGRLARVEEKLYKGLERRVEDHNDVRKEWNTLMQECNFRPSGKTKRIADELNDKLKENYEWFKSFDRRVYLVYVQMAKRLNDDAKLRELIKRYEFHLPLQNLYKRADDKRDKLSYYWNQLFNRPKETITQGLVSEAFYEFRQARKALKDILRDARDMNMPMLKNFTNEEQLDAFLLDEPLIKEMPETYVNTKWIDKMYRQLTQVIKRSARLYFKSVGNILALQEQVAKEFNAEVNPPSEPSKAGEDQIPEAPKVEAKKETPKDEDEIPETRTRRTTEDDEDDDRGPRRRRSSEDDEDDRPAKRKRTDDDDDDRSSRKRRSSEDNEDDDRSARRTKTEDDDDDRPSRRKRSSHDDEDDDRRPKRRRSSVDD